MNEQDRLIVKKAKAWVDKYYSNKVPGDNIKALVAIIDRLDRQLTNIMEAGEPFEKFVEHLEPVVRDNYIVSATRLASDRQCAGELNVAYLKYGNLRRLAQAMKEVKDE